MPDRDRSFGRGKLRKKKTSSGYVWQGDWRDANGKRNRKTLSSDHRVAERMLAEKIRERDRILAGLADERWDAP